ncbi:hypothetical protein [Flagellimonas okinawensis]|uniref:Arm DNA-binding domain-containing protein n=1 Tax=Flagellimonas okinawensis TaxID=3031324 RepID=A0ABT5XRR1_9FLAO|nr:hypothetical protein [[Muricauda] okinawensis]MDF0708593.1 hypothetical protein [[Muricauda] okinawensis]
MKNSYLPFIALYVETPDIVYHPRRVKVTIAGRTKVTHPRRAKVDHLLD